MNKLQFGKARLNALRKKQHAIWREILGKFKEELNSWIRLLQTYLPGIKGLYIPFCTGALLTIISTRHWLKEPSTETDPPTKTTIKIAGGKIEGIYYQIAHRLKQEGELLLIEEELNGMIGQAVDLSHTADPKGANPTEESAEGEPKVPVAIEVIETKGSSENLDYLRKGLADLAIVQGDIANRLGPGLTIIRRGLQKETLYFVTNRPDILLTTSDASWKVILMRGNFLLPNKGMGSRITTEKFFRALGIEPHGDSYDSVENAVRRLNSHAIDGFFLVSGPEHPALRTAIAENEVRQLGTIEFPDYHSRAMLVVREDYVRSNSLSQLIELFRSRKPRT